MDAKCRRLALQYLRPARPQAKQRQPGQWRALHLPKGEREGRKALAPGVAPTVRVPGGQSDLRKGAARVAYARGHSAVGKAPKTTVTAARPVRDRQPDPVLAARAVTSLLPSYMRVA